MGHPARCFIGDNHACGIRLEGRYSVHARQRPCVLRRAAPSGGRNPGFVPDFSKYANRDALDKAARRYRLGLDQGLDEDELLALELGVGSLAELTDTQRAYKDKVKQKLAQRASELAAEEAALKARLARHLEQGKRAYECGEYPAAVQLLEEAVRDTGGDSALGGEAQLWLGLAYQACGREKEAIALYKEVEANHPIKKVKKQAADLRFILEAPRLEIGEDERVKIPLIQSDSWRQKERASYAPKFTRPASSASKQDNYWDRLSLDAPDPLAALPDRWYVRVAFAVLLLGCTVAANYVAVGK
ncbi:hypothetical protein Agub_g4903 [Astrephomene gubernaculifera]|uniref:Tetratricopeptide repeat protein n=1 Tax=Astrephomene gubernaculifera TaxID=47775 RepID=A0AAD3DPZ5_9CHLO|nr:hypothetical protein Agub_g4903 [Astrephomene gubernaculifera]